MIQAGHFRAAVSRFWPLYLTSIPGLLIGLTILVSIDVEIAKALLGLVLIAYALWALKNRIFILSGAWERRLKVPAGFCTGLVNGLTGSQVMPVLPYLLSLDLNKNVFIQAINVSFTLSSLIMLIGMNRLGHLSADTLLTACGGLFPALITVYLAGRLRDRISGGSHRKLVLAFLLVMGSILLARALV
jgi:uncharacterized membrane protein YfcA